MQPQDNNLQNNQLDNPTTTPPMDEPNKPDPGLSSLPDNPINWEDPSMSKYHAKGLFITGVSIVVVIIIGLSIALVFSLNPKKNNLGIASNQKTSGQTTGDGNSGDSSEPIDPEDSSSQDYADEANSDDSSDVFDIIDESVAEYDPDMEYDYANAPSDNGEDLEGIGGDPANPTVVTANYKPDLLEQIL